MGCNCKNSKKKTKKVINEILNTEVEKPTNNVNNLSGVFIKILVFLSKVLVFLLVTPITIVIVPIFIIFLLFKMIFLNEGVDITSNLTRVVKTLFGKKNNEHIDDIEDDIEEYNEEEYETINIDNVK